jgi:hypothetical protein
MYGRADRLSNEHSDNNLDRLTNLSGQALTDDADGNLTSGGQCTWRELTRRAEFARERTTLGCKEAAHLARGT